LTDSPGARVQACDSGASVAGNAVQTERQRVMDLATGGRVVVAGDSRCPERTTAMGDSPGADGAPPAVGRSMPDSALQVDGSHLAARLAARLIAGGLRFECEQLDRESWRFAVAPAAHPLLLALHVELATRATAVPWQQAHAAATPGGAPSC